jgi:hypothetical protein
LNAILSVYFVTRTVLIVITLCSDKNGQYFLHVMMSLLVILVVVTAVLPGRIVRKCLMTAKVIIFCRLAF